MKKVLIIGGGLAGLTAASILSSKNYSVTLLESSPKLGGRAYSIKDVETNSIIDNGQHILMGCYKETLTFLNLIGAKNNFEYQKFLNINFLSKDRFIYFLKADKLFYPFNLVYAIINYDAFELNDKINFISFVLKLPFQSKKSLQKLSVIDWLQSNNQTSNSIKMFWEILCVGALNTNLKNASAFMFHKILLEIFLKGNFASTIILPKYGLSESIIVPASKFIEKNNGVIFSSEQVKDIIVKNNKVVRIVTSNYNFTDFDFVISAIPLFNIQKIFDLKTIDVRTELEYSTIVNIHIWSDEINFDEKFYGVLDSHLHWIFKKDNHINIVISNADYLVEKTKEEILNSALEELSKYLNFNPEKIKSYKIIKEKRATFTPTQKTINNRPESITKIKNLFLAGDWINTELPSTIESAVKSGKIAAENIINQD